MFAFIFDSHLDDDPSTFQPPPWVSIVAVFALTITSLLAVFIYLGTWLAILLTLSAAMAAALWLRVGYTTPISRRALSAHILLIVAQLFHGAELLGAGYANHIVKAFPDLIQPANIITDASVALCLSLCTATIWLIGGAFAFYHVRAGGFAVLMLAIWSIVWPASHFLIPLLSATTSGWMPGIVTGPILAVLAIVSLRFILSQSPRRPLS